MKNPSDPRVQREDLTVHDGRSNSNAAARLSIVIFCAPSILSAPLVACGNAEDCASSNSRYEQLSKGAIECGDSLSDDLETLHKVVECLTKSKAACKTGRGKIFVSMETGATLYGLVVDDECQITILSGESPGHPDVGFSEQACKSIRSTMTGHDFVAEECSEKIDYRTCG